MSTRRFLFFLPFVAAGGCCPTNAVLLLPLANLAPGRASGASHRAR